jgi:hypothetical protein
MGGTPHGYGTLVFSSGAEYGSETLVEERLVRGAIGGWLDICLQGGVGKEACTYMCESNRKGSCGYGEGPQIFVRGS